MAGESNSEAMQNFSAFASNVLMKDTLESARRTTQMADQALGMTLKGMVELDPTQAISQVKAFTGFDNASQSHDLGRTFADLGAAVSAIQQMVKGAQSTPPVSYPPA